jgi:hypothetical protein
VSTKADAAGRTDEQILHDRQEVERVGPDRIGADFACAIVSGRTAEAQGRLRIYVTHPRALPRAEALRATLASSEITEVKLTSARFAHDTMTRIRQAIQAAAPDATKMTSASIGRENQSRISRCPRIKIRILPPGQAGPAVERWAADAVARYGPDRVVVERRSGARAE